MRQRSVKIEKNKKFLQNQNAVHYAIKFKIFPRNDDIFYNINWSKT